MLTSAHQKKLATKMMRNTTIDSFTNLIKTSTLRFKVLIEVVLIEVLRRVDVILLPSSKVLLLVYQMVAFLPKKEETQTIKYLLETWQVPKQVSMRDNASICKF